MAPSKLCTAQCLQLETDKSIDSNLSFTARLLHYLGLQIHQGLNFFVCQIFRSHINLVLIIIFKKNPLVRFQDFPKDELTRNHETASNHSGYDKRKFSTKTINDRQLSSQKIRQKLSAIITNTYPPLQTLLFSIQNVKENAKINHFFNIIKSK